MKRWRLFAIISLMLFCALLYAQSIPTSVPLNPETAKESTSDEVLPKAEMESPSQPQTNNAVSQGISRQPAEEKPYYLESYLKALEDYPQLVFVEHFGRILSKPIVFIFLLILIGKGGSKLTHRCLLSRHQRQSGHAEEPIPHWISGIIILVWLFALGIASEAVGLDWVSDVGGVIVRLVGTILGAIVWLVVGGLIAAVLAYAFSHEGRELTLSLLGGLWYLTKDPTKPDKDRRFDLGDGKCGKIQTVRLLHTIFTADDGKQEIRPNALAMRQHYHWAGTSK